MHIAIIGNGISGITAARHIRKLSNYSITVISSETEHFYSRTALMYIYMGHMKFENTKPYEDFFWKKNRIDLVFDHVNEIKISKNELVLASGKLLKYDKLIIATGSKSNVMPMEGVDLEGVQGLYHWQDLQKMELRTKAITNAVVVGGGLIGIEMAEMLKMRKIDVQILIREDRFWGNILPKEDAEIVEKEIARHNINLIKEDELLEICGDNGEIKGIKTKKGRQSDVQFLGLTIGVSPNIEFVKASEIETNRGVLVNEYLETNVPNIYSIGDCAEFKVHPVSGRRNIEQVWYTGKIMGETVAQTICGKRTKYNPGPWFNSAKFFDLEYQTYGNVSAEPQENETRFFWKSENSKQAIHIVSDKLGKFIGINAFGIRLRHAFFDEALKNNWGTEKVLSTIYKANFDPELYKDWIKEFITEYNKTTSSSISIHTKKWYSFSK